MWLYEMGGFEAFYKEKGIFNVDRRFAGNEWNKKIG